MSRVLLRATLLCLALACTLPVTADSSTRLLRYPDIHGDLVVFSYAADLWLASSDSGDARRLTAHPGLELFAKFSPDGRWIAFTGQYDGDEQVYVVPTSGGVPKQLTWYPARGPLPARWGHDNQVHGWTPDGKQVLFRSLRDGVDTGDSRLYLVPASGGLPVALPMSESGAGDFAPDGGRLVYSPTARDFRSWKRYAGGWAQDLYIFDLETFELEQVTRDARSDRDPMWIGDKIYFSSDRDGTLNLYRHDLVSKKQEQLTHGREWDVRWPSDGPSDDGEGHIVYEQNGELQIYDLATGVSRSLAIHVPNDGVAMRPSRVSAANQIENWRLSPKGERALFGARGDIFSVPIQDGPTRNLTRSSGAHDKWAEWSPDGSRIAFISDLSGEEELYVIAQDGSGEPERLTVTSAESGDAVMRYAPTWSPDGSRIAFSDKNGRLWVVNVSSHQQTLVADEPLGFMNSYVWSPHGGHLAFDLSDSSGFLSLYIWSLEDGKARRVTGELFNEHTPAWDPKGNYLYYLSDREFAPLISPAEWDYAVTRNTGVFAIALRQDVPHPFPPKSDEVTVEEKKDEEEDGSKNEKDDGKDDVDGANGTNEVLEIDFEGLAQRVARVPVEADNYFGLAATETHLIYLRGPSFYMGRAPETPSRVEVFSFKERKATTLAERVGGFAISDDGKKILVGQGASYQLFDVGSTTGRVVSTRGLMVDRVPAEEWEQIFDEAWRRFRDFFYVPNMHGYDWPALAAQYRPLLAHVAHRSDLNYVIGEMIGELSVGHAYIAGGDWQQPPRPQVALPGVRFELDGSSGRYRIARILRGQNEELLYRSPLTEIGVEVHAGDYVLAIDGEELLGGDNPYRLLVHKADRPVTLTVSPRPSAEDRLRREVTFRPITDEQNLIYLEGVERNRRRVSEMTDGRVGYLHIPDMGASGIREFIKHFYAQIRKEGLVVDVRRNGGGNVSQMIIERLTRELLGTSFSRNSDSVSTYPRAVFHGPMACLLDSGSGSDGDIFPHMFRQAGLGPLIGKRSWGGVVGISGRGPLLDGGQVFVPEFSTNDVDGSYMIEGHGVDPDIEVDNDPKSELEGRDLQLERAVQEILKQLEESPQPLPKRPADPVKTK